MHSELNDREQAVLQVIKDNIRKKGYPPSVREIGMLVGFSSSSTVHGYLRRLEQKGYIRRDPTKPRAIEILNDLPELERVDNDEFIEVPVIGQVAAGLPLLAVENIEDTFTLPRTFTGYGELFILRVRGKSMIEAGILEGDLLLVRKQPNAVNGDIVVALIENEATVKRFYKEKNFIRLQPENKDMEPIIVQDVNIIGKVIGLMRKL